jgi:hypothetical protein
LLVPMRAAQRSEIVLPKPLEPFFNRYRRCVCGGRSARDSLIVYLDKSASVAKRMEVITLLPNENKINHRWRGRAGRRDMRLESWKTWAYVGQRSAASHG